MGGTSCPMIPYLNSNKDATEQQSMKYVGQQKVSEKCFPNNQQRLTLLISIEKVIHMAQRSDKMSVLILIGYCP